MYLQWDIQWLGLGNIVGSVVGGIAIGKLHDHFRHFKVLLASFFFLGGAVYLFFIIYFFYYHLTTATFVVFSLATERIIICTYWELLVLDIAAGFALGATYPRFSLRHSTFPLWDCRSSPVSYEALVEVTYPVKEEVSAGLLSLMVLLLREKEKGWSL